MAETTIVPFGKYKNQPLAALAQDREYREWLLGQDWFVQRYPNMHTIIINNFGEPNETPEHNALQLRFLDEDVRQRCSLAFLGFAYPASVLASVGVPIFEHGGHDVTWEHKAWFCHEATTYKSDEYPYQPISRPAYWSARTPNHNFLEPVRVECKPSLGDDYPQVLRYMKSLNAHGNVLCVGEYTFRGGSLTDIRRFFAHSRILLISVEALLSVPKSSLIQSESQLPSPDSFLDMFTASRKATLQIV